MLGTLIFKLNYKLINLIFKKWVEMIVCENKKNSLDCFEAIAFYKN